MYAPLFQGKVVDFIDIDFFDINLFGTIYDRWPIFNVADLAVSIGVILLIFFSRITSKEEIQENFIQNKTSNPIADITELNSENTINKKPDSDTDTEVKN